MSAEITTFLYRTGNYWKEQWGLPLSYDIMSDRHDGRSKQDLGIMQPRQHEWQQVTTLSTMQSSIRLVYTRCSLSVNKWDY